MKLIHEMVLKSPISIAVGVLGIRLRNVWLAALRIDFPLKNCPIHSMKISLVLG